MESDVHTVENMAARSAFIRLVTTRPDPTAMAHALTRGPLAIYGAFTSTIFAPDDAGTALALVGEWGGGPTLNSYTSVPLAVDLPVVRSYLTGQPMVVGPDAQRRDVLLDTAIAGLAEDAGLPANAVTIVSMPLHYEGVTIGSCVWACTHPGPWTWNDHAYIDGTAAVISLWLQLRTYESSLPTSGYLTGGAQLLTERQRTVLALIRDGKSNAAIAANLGYSISTVKNDVAALFTVLGASRRKELVRRAEEAGLLTQATGAAE